MGSSTIQPRSGEDHYPIGRFILHRARTLGLSRNDLVYRLRYPDTESGHEALTAALLTGLVAPHVVNHLAGVLEADDALVGFVIRATRRQKRDEARLDHPIWKLQDAVSGKKRRLLVEREQAYL